MKMLLHEPSAGDMLRLLLLLLRVGSALVVSVQL
jgi:hypothetical protein